MARATGFPYSYRHVLGSGSGPSSGLLDHALFTRASRRGVPAILIEAGGGLPPDEKRVRRGADAVTSVLRQLGVLRGSPDHSEPVTLHGFLIVTPSTGGVMEPVAQLGDRVSEGKLLARIRNLHDEVVEELRAPHEGVILTASLDRAVGTGSWAFEIGW